MHEIMDEIRNTKGDSANYELPRSHNRTASQSRQWFLRHFIQAQMVAYESAPSDDDNTKLGGVSRGWFYWTLKMEFGALGEWDFLRGVKEGWFPTLPGPSESAESLYGTCREIAEKTEDDNSIVQAFPDPKTHPDLWNGPAIDDDFVLSHAESLDETGKPKKDQATTQAKTTTTTAANNNNAKNGAKKDDTANKKATATTTSKTSNKSTDTKKSSRSGDKGKNSDETGKRKRKGVAQGWFPIFCFGFIAWGIWKVFLKDANFVRNRRQYTNLDTPTQLSV